MCYTIRYRPDTDLGRRFPHPAGTTFPDRETAEAIRVACPNTDSMEIVEVEE